MTIHGKAAMQRELKKSGETIRHIVNKLESPENRYRFGSLSQKEQDRIQIALGFLDSCVEGLPELSLTWKIIDKAVRSKFDISASKEGKLIEDFTRIAEATNFMASGGKRINTNEKDRNKEDDRD